MPAPKIHADEPTIAALKALTGAEAVRVQDGQDDDGKPRYAPGYHRTAPVQIQVVDADGKPAVHEHHYLSFEGPTGRTFQVPSTRVAEHLAAQAPASIPKPAK